MYDILQDRLNEICPENNLKNEFLIVIKSVTVEGAMVALVSTLPLYYCGISSANSLYWGNLNNTVYNYLEVWDSTDDGETWTKRTSGSIGNLTYKSKSEYWECTSTNGFGFAQMGNVIYNNYPILYSCKKHSGGVADSNFNTTDNRKLFKDATVAYPLKRVPYGAIIRFGRWKKEEADGDVHDLFWYVQDYTRRLRVHSEIANYPEDCVYLTSKHIIDVLTYNNHKNYNIEECYDGNANLPKWLNSSKSAGEWFFPSCEKDTPPSVENMSSAFSKNAYSEKAGFLHRFSNAEISLMQPSNLEAIKYKTDHVTLFYWAEFYPSRGETATHNTLLTRSAFAQTRNYHIAMLKGANAITSSVGNDAYTLSSNSEYRWSRNKKNSSQGYKPDGTATLAYEAQPVVPTCFINADTMVKGIDKEGFFILQLPEVTEPFEDLYECKRVVEANVDKSYELERNVISCFDLDVVIEDLERKIIQNFQCSFSTSIYGTKFHAIPYNSTRRVIRDVEKFYSTERNIVEEFDIAQKFPAKRLISKTYKEKVGYTSRKVLGILEKNFPHLQRNVIKYIDRVFETVRNTTVYFNCNLQYDTTRFIQKNVIRNHPTQVKVVNNKSLKYPSVRNVFANEVLRFSAKRQVANDIDLKERYTIRYVANSFKNSFNTNRYIAEPCVFRFDAHRQIQEKYLGRYLTMRKVNKEENLSAFFKANRYVISSNESIYNSMRKIIAESLNTVDVLRYIVQDVEFKANCERYIIESIASNYELSRDILNDFEKINEAVIYVLNNAEQAFDTELNIVKSFNIENQTLREVLNMLDIDYPTKRVTTATTNKYVSKDNLMLYTILLKQEIAQFIDLRISEEFAKRNL